jgi:amino acid transporter
MCLIRLSFDSLIQLQSLVYGVVVIVICSSVIKLRISQPERHRPYKLLNTDRLPIVILVAMGPICLSFYIIATVCIGDWAYGVALLLIWLLLFVWHGLCSIRKEFNEIEEDEVRKGLVN